MKTRPYKGNTMDHKIGDRVQFTEEDPHLVFTGEVVSYCTSKHKNVCAVVFLDEKYQGYLHDDQGRQRGYISHIVVALDCLKAEVG